MRTGTGAAAAGLALIGALMAGCADTGGPLHPGPTSAVSARCRDERFPIYFARGSADLQPESRDVIRSASRRVTGCRIAAVDVVGVAAPDGPGVADPTLTQRRADAVAQALAQGGLPAPSFDVQVAGSPPPPAGVRTPLARRTEVVLHALPAT